MSRRFEVACVQADGLGADPASRRAAMVHSVREAGWADLIVLPELWTVGYFAFDEYVAAAEPLQGPTLAMLADAARSVNAHVVLGSFIERSPDGLHNTTAVIDPRGRLLATYRKVHVFGYGSREIELVTGGTEPVVVDTGVGRLGLAICYDLRFPELFRALVDRSAQVFVVPAAWPGSRTEHWRLLLRARAVENQAYVVACNGAGDSAGTLLGGFSAVVDPWGETVGEAGLEPTTLRAVVELDRLDACREDFPALADRRLGRPDRMPA